MIWKLHDRHYINFDHISSIEIPTVDELFIHFNGREEPYSLVSEELVEAFLQKWELYCILDGLKYRRLAENGEQILFDKGHSNMNCTVPDPNPRLSKEEICRLKLLSDYLDSITGELIEEMGIGTRDDKTESM